MSRTRLRLAPLLLLGALVLLAPAPALSQTADQLEALRGEVEKLKQGQKAILDQLSEIQGLLQGRRTRESFSETEIGVAGAPALGQADAKVTLVEFSDYQCPFCRRHMRQTMPRLIKAYVETGKLRYVFRDFPIGSLHPAAFEAALGARCAGEQGKYWELHDRFFANPKAAAIRDWPAHAEALGLDLAGLQACLEDERYKPQVRKDMADGRRAGVRGTPTFFLGLTKPGAATFKATRKLVGAQPYARFKEAIDSLLAKGS